MHNIEKILTEAKQNKWPYPKTLDALRAEGVTSYKVTFKNDYQAIYKGEFGTWKEATPNGYQAVLTATTFDSSKVQKAIMNHIEKNTSYTEVLVDLAASGVAHYLVDAVKRTVTYYNNDESMNYSETVPTNNFS